MARANVQKGNFSWSTLYMSVLMGITGLRLIIKINIYDEGKLRNDSSCKFVESPIEAKTFKQEFGDWRN